MIDALHLLPDGAWQYQSIIDGTYASLERESTLTKGQETTRMLSRVLSKRRELAHEKIEAILERRGHSPLDFELTTRRIEEVHMSLLLAL